MLPSSVLSSVQDALAARAGRAVAIRAAQPIGGGCINPAARLETTGVEAYFVKWNASAPPGMFEAEADGLAAIDRESGAAGVRVPEVIATHGGDPSTPAWLLLEFVERGRAPPDFGERLGRGLAALHRRREPPPPFGWKRDNFIGSLEQRNPPGASWPDFWRDQRLAPQLALARAQGRFTGGPGRTLDRLLERTADALTGAEAEGASLLHGDLWSGNVYPGPAGEPVLIDPAVYVGHREVDVAMSELFGGFPVGFLEAYHEARPIAPAYRRVRRQLYQLYYLLVHVNLFGGSYVGGCLAAAEAVLGEV
jgi:fructosamine-3-kinase